MSLDFDFIKEVMRDAERFYGAGELCEGCHSDEPCMRNRIRKAIADIEEYEKRHLTGKVQVINDRGSFVGRLIVGGEVAAYDRGATPMAAIGTVIYKAANLIQHGRFDVTVTGFELKNREDINA